MSVCLEPPTFPIIATGALLIEYQPIGGTIYINVFPITGEDMAVVTGLERHRWRRGIHGHSQRNRQLGADENERGTDVSWEHVGISTQIGLPTYHFDKQASNRSCESDAWQKA